MGVIFDFDGLLMDTETTLLASWEFEWSQWGLELDRDGFFAPHGGDVNADRYDALARAVGPRFDRAASDTRRMAYREQLNAELKLADGISDWLRAGVRLAVASSSVSDWVTGNLRRAGVLDAFDAIACGDEVARHKPAPDVYLLALHRLGTTGAGWVAVEDTPHGVDAAHAAGLACIAIPNLYVQPADVAHAELVLTSARDMTLPDAMSTALAARGGAGHVR